jgi:hypothetical protein
MKRNMFLLLAAMIFIVVAIAQGQYHKYDIKSGIATIEIESNIASMKIKMTKIVYFDDYGMKECEETYSKGKLSGILLCDGKNKYGVDPNKKTAQNMGPSSSGTGTRIDINDMGTEKDIKSGKVKVISPMTIAGQTCEVIQVSRSKTPDIYAGWHKVMVYLKSSSSGVSTLIKAVKLEPNAAVPKEKFEIPAGYTLQ